MRSDCVPECYATSAGYERRVKEIAREVFAPAGIKVDISPSGQMFPDIPIGEYGIEVKYTRDDKWVSIANSIREKQCADGVEHIYLMFGKMGGEPESRWAPYDECVVHVRTSHDPRFQVDMTGTKESLFVKMGIPYESFRKLDMMEKMVYVRKYSRQIHPDGRLWWLGDSNEGEGHTTSVEVRIYKNLDVATKDKLRAEALVLCPQVLIPDRAKGSDRKYDDAVLFLMTYHGVLVSNARDLFTAGSAAGVTKKDGFKTPYIYRCLIRHQDKMLEAFDYLEDSLFDEYWGEKVPKAERVNWWIHKADEYAQGREKRPSDFIFPSFDE